MIVEEKKKQSVAESTATKKAYSIQQDSSEGSGSGGEISRIQAKPLQKSVLNVSINSQAQSKQPKNSVQYEYRSWLSDCENENLIGNLGDNLTSSSPKNIDNAQPLNQEKIILTQLNP